MIGALTPFVRSPLTPQSDPRGNAGNARGDNPRVGRDAPFDGRTDSRTQQPNQPPTSPQGGPQARGTGTQTSQPVPPPQGLLALGMDSIEALQGIKPALPGEKPDQTVDHRGEKQAATGQLSEEEAEQVRELKARDQEVRRHEQAHAAAGGAHAGAPSYQYQQGPDGQRYAVGGEVPIDVSPVRGDPNATIQKMRQVKAAANAPAQPSGQDRSVAATADAISQRAQAELLAKATEETKGVEGEETPTGIAAPSSVDGSTAPQAEPVAGPEIGRKAGPDARGEALSPTSEKIQPTEPGGFRATSQARSRRDIAPGSFTDISV